MYSNDPTDILIYSIETSHTMYGAYENVYYEDFILFNKFQVKNYYQKGHYKQNRK